MDRSENQTDQQNGDGFPSHTPPVYCGSLPVVQNLFSCPLLIEYGIAGNRVTNRIPCTSHDCCIALPRVGLEHPRPHALCLHLVGDIHQPLHTAQLFTVEYRTGDRGGNEICVRVTQAGQPMDLHRFWDGVSTSSQNLTRLRNEATALRNRQEFQRNQLTELGSMSFERLLLVKGKIMAA